MVILLNHGFAIGADVFAAAMDEYNETFFWQTQLNYPFANCLSLDIKKWSKMLWHQIK
jgi:hypothetical protein